MEQLDFVLRAPFTDKGGLYEILFSHFLGYLLRIRRID